MVKLAMLSDTHGLLPPIESVPRCDILVHSGDVCPDGWGGVWCRKDFGRSALWLREVFVPWLLELLESGRINFFVGTFGNHDWVTRMEAQELNLIDPRITFLIDAYAEVEGLRIWGSPWSNEFMNWAWMLDPAGMQQVFMAVPAEVDVLLSHTPPVNCGCRHYDMRSGVEEDIGSLELAIELPRINPQLVVCGHIHFARGTYSLGGVHVENASYVNEQYRHPQGWDIPVVEVEPRSERQDGRLGQEA